MSNNEITTMQQFERLPVGSVINLRRTGAATVRWTHAEAGYWTEPNDNDRVATRFFRGAVEAGFVTTGTPGADEPGWAPGAWFTTNNDNGYRYLVTESDMSGNIHNCMQISNYRAERAVVMERNLPDYHAIDVPTTDETAGWFADALTKAQPKSSITDDLAEGLVAYAGKVNDDDLFDLLDNSGVDTAPRTTVTIAGSTVIDGETLNMQVGATALLSEVRVPWSQTVEGIRVKRGCLCESTWEDAVLDSASVVGALPPSHDESALTYTVTCPVHADK